MCVFLKWGHLGLSLQARGWPCTVLQQYNEMGAGWEPSYLFPRVLCLCQLEKHSLSQARRDCCWSCCCSEEPHPWHWSNIFLPGHCSQAGSPHVPYSCVGVGAYPCALGLGQSTQLVASHNPAYAGLSHAAKEKLLHFGLMWE